MGWWWAAYVAAKKLQKNKYFFKAVNRMKAFVCWYYSAPGSMFIVRVDPA